MLLYWVGVFEESLCGKVGLGEVSFIVDRLDLRCLLDI